MKNNISLLLLSLFAVFFFTACEDDDDPFTGPYRVSILGPDTVAPESTEQFTIGNFLNPESYTWTVVDGPAEIVGSNTGATVDVRFTSVGDVTLSVTNGQETGTTTVEVENVAPAVTGSLNDTGVLASGMSDTVFFEFDAPVAEIGSFGFNTEDSTAFNEGGTPFVSGAIGDLVQVNDQLYYAVYTAGAGNGTSEVRFTDVVSTGTFGADTVETAYVQLYRVDNIAPVADLAYSTEVASEGSMVMVTTTFSEEVMSADPADSVLFITVDGERDTLMATDDPLVYTYEYEVGEGDGPIEVGLENVVDLAGNELAGVNNATELVLDNTGPVVTGTATDAGSGASIAIGSSEAGTAMYLVLNDGAAAPTNAEEFMDTQGVASRSVQISAGGGVRTVTQALAAGDYDVYFLARDEAGNFSAIETADLLMD
ncbi:hypothetical protein CLV24_10537 [Pontibacter ummariensis]|uniref:PKD domain-containing protein n=1 Tax=Pontibacter ummariensis TaxID=1610492 RepID=A0A239E0M3_9BACT|nr:hypothetical protein [Pontibacter ummariensis]PRY13667.1 hypothetical protein CLV24_10537 [Pontibacter ummariensis]SNS37931.1 hypothetical protein SAMN06296052_105214 [Pontibacter ummariensis]